MVRREFEAGEPLTEEDLARRFGCSRTPIREALRRLERDGLLTLVPHKGAFVNALSAEDLRELFDLREALEAYTAREAARSADAAALEGFRVRFRDLGGRRATYAEVRAVAEELHRYIAKAAGNSRVAAILAQVQDQLKAARTLAIIRPGRIQAVISEHGAIIGALARKNPGAAERAMRSHIGRTRREVARLLGEGTTDRSRR
jgi:DNA-binding GntR family transcriptional regulator